MVYFDLPWPQCEEGDECPEPDLGDVPAGAAPAGTASDSGLIGLVIALALCVCCLLVIMAVGFLMLRNKGNNSQHGGDDWDAGEDQEMVGGYEVHPLASHDDDA